MDLMYIAHQSGYTRLKGPWYHLPALFLHIYTSIGPYHQQQVLEKSPDTATVWMCWVQVHYPHHSRLLTCCNRAWRSGPISPVESKDYYTVPKFLLSGGVDRYLLMQTQGGLQAGKC